jgi:hypothetical protein
VRDRIDGDGAADQAEALRHADQTETAMAVRQLLRVKPDSVILHGERDGIGRRGEGNDHLIRPRMFHHIRQTLLGDAVETGGNGLRHGRRRRRHVERALKIRACRAFIDQALQGNGQSQVVQNGRMKLIGQMAHVVRQLGEPVLDRA